MDRTVIEISVAFLPVLYVSIFVHELGHAVAGKLSGFIVTAFGMGLVRPILVLKAGGTRVFLCLVRPLQGLTVWLYPALYPPKGRLILTLTGGSIANSILALVGILLWMRASWGTASG
jgi:hypothetical protein